MKYLLVLLVGLAYSTDPFDAFIDKQAASMRNTGVLFAQTLSFLEDLNDFITEEDDEHVFGESENLISEKIKMFITEAQAIRHAMIAFSRETGDRIRFSFDSVMHSAAAITVRADECKSIVTSVKSLFPAQTEEENWRVRSARNALTSLTKLWHVLKIQAEVHLHSIRKNFSVLVNAMAASNAAFIERRNALTEPRVEAVVESKEEDLENLIESKEGEEMEKSRQCDEIEKSSEVSSSVSGSVAPRPTGRTKRKRANRKLRESLVKADKAPIEDIPEGSITPIDGLSIEFLEDTPASINASKSASRGASDQSIVDDSAIEETRASREVSDQSIVDDSVLDETKVFQTLAMDDEHGWTEVKVKQRGTRKKQQTFIVKGPARVNVRTIAQTDPVRSVTPAGVDHSVRVESEGSNSGPMVPFEVEFVDSQVDESGSRMVHTEATETKQPKSKLSINARPFVPASVLRGNVGLIAQDLFFRSVSAAGNFGEMARMCDFALSHPCDMETFHILLAMRQQIEYIGQTAGNLISMSQAAMYAASVNADST
jgi:hypothetical protein